jgi:hypothetical protein
MLILIGKFFDFVITNTKITVGINFDELHFDSVYAGIAGFNMTRDVIQATYRSRYSSPNKINVCFFDKSNTKLLLLK